MWDRELHWKSSNLHLPRGSHEVVSFLAINTHSTPTHWVSFVSFDPNLFYLTFKPCNICLRKHFPFQHKYFFHNQKKMSFLLSKTILHINIHFESKQFLYLFWRPNSLWQQIFCTLAFFFRETIINIHGGWGVYEICALCAPDTPHPIFGLHPLPQIDFMGGFF